MTKSLLLLLMIFCAFFTNAQVDTSKAVIATDSLKAAVLSNPDSLKISKDSTLKQSVTSPTTIATDSSAVPNLSTTVNPTVAPSPTIVPQTTVATQTATTEITPPDSLKKVVLAPDSGKTTAPPDSIIPPKIIDVAKYQAIRVSADSIKFAKLDALTEDELLEYYLSEPLPLNDPRRASSGDTLYNILNPLTIPTKTVEGQSLYYAFSEPLPEDSMVYGGALQLQRPKIGIGMGRIAYHGDISTKRMQTVLLGRPAIDISISQRMTRYLQLDFSIFSGKFGATENSDSKHMNMLTEIRSGGINVLYDFGNFLNDSYRIRPYVSLGLYGFEFLSKTDLKDASGKAYHYWSDGSIRDKAEGSADAQFSQELKRDYVYESDIREQNNNNFGNYKEAAFAIPVGIGAIMKITDRIDLKLNYQYYFTSTDNIDGIRGEKGLQIAGSKSKDNLSYLSIGLQYDLVVKKIKRVKSANDTIDYSNPYLMALFNEDKDKDSVTDVNDACPGTPAGAKVDAKGCPEDLDVDGVADHKDEEKNSPQGFGVNQKGVARTDAYWQKWYDDYMNDSLPGEKITEYTGNIYAVAKKKDKKDPYTVELMRYNGAIPSDELAFLLSIGDINSTTLDDGTTVVYTSGNYEKLGTAIKRRDEFRGDGNKNAGVSMFKDRDVIQLPEDELQSLLNSEISELLKMNVNDSTRNLANVVTTSTPDEAFNSNEIVYRVQLGAFRNKISTSIFGNSIGVLELKTGENVYRYVTKGYSTIEEAAATRADLVVQGYSDAFVTAYRGGRRIPMSETKATVEKDYKEDTDETKTFSSIDKNLLAFKVQLGPLKKRSQEAAMDARVKDLQNVKKTATASGTLRYTAGSFPGLEVAEEYRKTLEAKGFFDAFVIPTFKEEVISMQEAMELLK